METVTLGQMVLTIIAMIFVISILIHFDIRAQKKSDKMFCRHKIFSKIDYMENTGDETDQFEAHMAEIKGLIKMHSFNAKDFNLASEYEIKHLRNTYYATCAELCIDRLRRKNLLNALNSPWDEHDYRIFRNLLGFAEKTGWPDLKQFGLDQKETQKFKARIVKAIAYKHIADTANLLGENNMTFSDIGITINEEAVAEALKAEISNGSPHLTCSNY